MEVQVGLHVHSLLVGAIADGIYKLQICLRTGDETMRRKETQKGNPLPHVQVGGKVMSYPNKLPPPPGVLSRAASDDDDQVENDNKNLFFMLSPQYNYTSLQDLLNLPIGSYCL